jgi:hypothetical protein
MSCIAHKHAAQTSTEHQCRTQTRWASTDDDDVENFGVGRGGRLRRDHNSRLKSSAAAENKDQNQRAHHRNNQRTDATQTVGEECEHYP